MYIELHLQICKYNNVEVLYTDHVIEPINFNYMTMQYIM